MCRALSIGVLFLFQIAVSVHGNSSKHPVYGNRHCIHVYLKGAGFERSLVCDCYVFCMCAMTKRSREAKCSPLGRAVPLCAKPRVTVGWVVHSGSGTVRSVSLHINRLNGWTPRINLHCHFVVGCPTTAVQSCEAPRWHGLWLLASTLAVHLNGYHVSGLPKPMDRLGTAAGRMRVSRFGFVVYRAGVLHYGVFGKPGF